MPESVPLLTKEKLCSFSTLTYREICLEIFEIFAGDEFVKTYSLDGKLANFHIFHLPFDFQKKLI